MANKILIIAEAGVNHNGDIKIARELVDAAAMAGANLVKFQTFNAARLVTPSAPQAAYQKRTASFDHTQLSMLHRLELNSTMHEELVSYCASRNIGFFSSAFDIPSVDYLHSLGVERFKIPSGEITNLPYLRHVGRFSTPLILSSGMATLGEIEAALDILENAGTPRSKITVLHCSSDYPASMTDVNLRAMLTVRDAFGVSVGYSDHTQGIEIPIAAAAMGATVIEKHLTIDQNLTGPDHKASLEPCEFTRMVQSIRNIELAMGDGLKRPCGGETENKWVVRKSIVADKTIKAGERFNSNNLTTKRPGTGISPMYWDNIIGKIAKRNYSKDDLIDL